MMGGNAMDSLWPTVQCVLFMGAALGAAAAVFVRGMGRWIGRSLLMMAGYFVLAMLCGQTSWWAPGIFVMGAALLALETVVPGGIVGVLGTLGILASMYLASPSPGYLTVQAVGALILCIAVIPPLRRRRGAQNLMAAFTNEEVTPAAESAAPVVDGGWMGRLAETRSPLRPMGTVACGSEEREAVSDEGYVPAGTTVEVIGVREGRLLVRKKKDMAE